jgi:polyhydroxybutyrate depolymerase
MKQPVLLFVASALAVIGAWLASASPGATPALATSCSPARTHASGTFERTLATADGRLRTYRLHVPPSYTGNDAMPLVFSFHGYTSNALAQEIYSGFSTEADQPGGGFIAVYPQGTLVGSNPFWNTTQLPLLVDDVAFVDELLDDLEANLCIDGSRVFSSGMSNGAQMSIRLACSLSSRIAAIMPVGGAYYPPVSNTFNPSEVCQDTRAVPVIAFHGTADAAVPFNGGQGGTLNYRLPLDNATPDEDVIEDWGTHDGCTGGRVETPVSDEVRLVTYDTCTDGAIAQLYIVDGGGHTWPGSFDVPGLGYTTQDIIATDLAWAFFQAHPLPGGKPAQPPPKDGVTDADGDGCTGAQETGPDIALGGQRHPKVFWDFFDTPAPPAFNRDRAISVSDIAAVVGRFGSSGMTLIDPLSTPPAPPGYHTGYDRTPGAVAGTSGPPNGSVTIQDISLVVSQFGHSCL